MAKLTDYPVPHFEFGRSFAEPPCALGTRVTIKSPVGKPYDWPDLGLYGVESERVMVLCRNDSAIPLPPGYFARRAAQDPHSAAGVVLDASDMALAIGGIDDQLAEPVPPGHYFWAVCVGPFLNSTTKWNPDGTPK